MDCWEEPLLSHLVMSYPLLSYHILFYHILSYSTLSYPATLNRSVPEMTFCSDTLYTPNRVRTKWIFHISSKTLIYYLWSYHLSFLNLLLLAASRDKTVQVLSVWIEEILSICYLKHSGESISLFIYFIDIIYSLFCLCFGHNLLLVLFFMNTLDKTIKWMFLLQ